MTNIYSNNAEVPSLVAYNIKHLKRTSGTVEVIVDKIDHFTSYFLTLGKELVIFNSDLKSFEYTPRCLRCEIEHNYKQGIRIIFYLETKSKLQSFVENIETKLKQIIPLKKKNANTSA